VHLHRQRPAASEATVVVAGEIVQRAYLGEHWDYAVRPAGSALLLRVTARPHEVFDAGEKVWLEVDPRQMAAIA
jgi:iron(III) transport system ATP-binding protein